MRINGKATFYLAPDHNTPYERVVLPVYWEIKKVLTYNEFPVYREALALYIPYAEGLEITANDVNRAVLGECEADGIDELALVKDFSAKKITTAQLWKAGSRHMWHWEVIAQ